MPSSCEYEDLRWTRVLMAIPIRMYVGGVLSSFSTYVCVNGKTADNRCYCNGRGCCDLFFCSDSYRNTSEQFLDLDQLQQSHGTRVADIPALGVTQLVLGLLHPTNETTRELIRVFHCTFVCHCENMVGMVDCNTSWRENTALVSLTSHRLFFELCSQIMSDHGTLEATS